VPRPRAPLLAPPLCRPPRRRAVAPPAGGLGLGALRGGGTAGELGRLRLLRRRPLRTAQPSRPTSAGWHPRPGERVARAARRLAAWAGRAQRPQTGAQW